MPSIFAFLVTFWNTATAMRRIFASVIILVSTVYLYLTIRHFIDSDVSYPVFDNWFYFADILTYLDKKDFFHAAVKQTNEHRPILTFISMIIDYSCFNYNFTFIKLLHLLSYVALVAFMLFLSVNAIDAVESSFRSSGKILVLVSGLFFLLSMRQWEVHYGYTNVGTIQAFLFFTSAVYLYLKRFDWRESGGAVTWKSLAMVIVFALLSTASMVFGLLTIPFVTFLSILQGARRGESLLLAVIGLMLFLTYGFGMDVSPAGREEWIIRAADLIRIVYFSLLLPGSLFVAQIPVALPIGIMGILVTIVSGIALVIRSKKISAELCTLYCVLMFSIVYAVMVGIGRRHMPDAQAMVSRYMLAAAIFWQALFTISLQAALSSHRLNRYAIRLYSAALVPVITVLMIHQSLKHDVLQKMATDNTITVHALRFGLFDSDTFPSYQFDDLNVFYSSAKILQDHRTSIYGSHYAKMYGQRIAHLFNIDNSSCTGSVSASRIIPIIKQLDEDSSLYGVKLAGRATNNPSTKQLPAQILLTDQNNRIRGSGLITPPTLFRQRRDTGTIEWVAFARTGQSVTEVRAYALYEQEGVVCKVGSVAAHNGK